MAAELGFEPRQTESESAVLPLHNSAMDNVDYYTPFSKKVKAFFENFSKKFYAFWGLMSLPTKSSLSQVPITRLTNRCV